MATIIAGVSILAIVFMSVFFVKLCAEGRRVKLCEVHQLDTKPCAPPGVVSHPASNLVVMTGTPRDRINNKRSRKPA